VAVPTKRAASTAASASSMTNGSPVVAFPSDAQHPRPPNNLTMPRRAGQTVGGSAELGVGDRVQVGDAGPHPVLNEQLTGTWAHRPTVLVACLPRFFPLSIYGHKIILLSVLPVSWLDPY
jgi:hypothetical protein